MTDELTRLKELAEKAIEVRRACDVVFRTYGELSLAAESNLNKTQNEFEEAATPELILSLIQELQSHKEWLKSRDEQIQRNYVKALDDGAERLSLIAKLEGARNEALEEAACLAETWKSALRPGTEARLFGHNEAGANIGIEIRKLKSNPTTTP